MEDWNSELGDWETIFTDIIGQSSTTVGLTYLASKETEIGEKKQNKSYNGYYAVQGHPGS